MSATQYSAKLDDIHIVVNGKAKCGKLMLATNYLTLPAEDRTELLKFHPRIICEKCLAKVK